MQSRLHGSGLIAAVQFLTRLPTPNVDVGLESALVWMPLVGLVLGGILAVVDLLLRWLQVGSLLTSVLLVVLLLALTGGLHADGLMDTCDAVFGHATPERRLEIMRDPHTGAFGVIGLVSVVLLKVAAVGGQPFGFLVLAPVIGRWVIVLAASVFPYGRTTGLGAPLKSAATPRTLALASVVPLVVVVVTGATGALAAAVAALSALAIGRWLTTLLPGLTGDCYGALCELSETMVWLCSAILLPHVTL